MTHPRNSHDRSSTADDAVLARAARAGDRAAFARLWERFAPVLHGILLAHVRSIDVPDLLQDVSLRALGAISELEDAEKFGGWIVMIARNRIKDHYRSRSRAPEASAEDVDFVAVAPAEPGHDRGSKILETIRALPATYREVLILRLVEGLSGPEISTRTELTPGSVRVVLCRGMKLLRAALRGADLE